MMRAGAPHRPHKATDRTASPRIPSTNGRGEGGGGASGRPTTEPHGTGSTLSIAPSCSSVSK